MGCTPATGQQADSRDEKAVQKLSSGPDAQSRPDFPTLKTAPDNASRNWPASVEIVRKSSVRWIQKASDQRAAVTTHSQIVYVLTAEDDVIKNRRPCRIMNTVVSQLYRLIGVLPSI